jgi:hypothetical protein
MAPCAAQEWTKLDTFTEAASLAPMVADWAQTLNIEWRNSHKHLCHDKLQACWERNPILGVHPSRAKVNLYFATVIVGHVLIAKKLDHGWGRYAFQGATFFYEYQVVEQNHKLGLAIKF